MVFSVNTLVQVTFRDKILVIDIETIKHVLELYAAAKGYELTPFADKIMNRCLNACNGCCPCDMSRGFCPCGEHQKEIEEMGHCHCNLFQKKA